MIVGSLSENLDFEKRVAITPEVVKKYKSIGLDVHLGKNYATHLGLTDKEYEQAGASIFSNSDEIISNSNAILQMNILDDESLNKLKDKQILIGVLNVYNNEKKLKEIT